MLSFLAKSLGQLASDVYEGVAYVGNEIIDAPSAFSDGLKEGGFIEPSSKPKEEDKKKFELKISESWTH